MTDGEVAQRAFGRIVVDLEPTIVIVAPERRPAGGRIADRDRDVGTPRQLGAGRVEPSAEGARQRSGYGLPRESSLVGQSAAHVLLDRIEADDMVQRLASGRRAGRGGDVEELAPVPPRDVRDAPPGHHRLAVDPRVVVIAKPPTQPYTASIRTIDNQRSLSAASMLVTVPHLWPAAHITRKAGQTGRFHLSAHYSNGGCAAAGDASLLGTAPYKAFSLRRRVYSIIGSMPYDRHSYYKQLNRFSC